MQKLPILVAVFLVAFTPAFARWPAGKPHSKDAAWFRSLYHNGISCCEESDGHRLSADFVRVRNGHYEFKAVPEAFAGAADDRWHPIPDDKLIRGRELAKFGGNPTGDWVIFTAVIWDSEQHPSFLIYCAIPPDNA